MDEFDKADRDDYLLDRADEQAIREQDWDELHGEWIDHPTLGEYLDLRRYCPHHDEVLDQYGKCRECYWQDKAYKEDHR